VVKALLSIFCFVLVNFSFSKISQAGECSNITDAANNDGYCVEVIVRSRNKQALAGMVVYLEPQSGQILATSTEPLVINQQNKTFSPYLSVIQANQETRFVNKDDITHHIYSVSRGNKFSFKIRAGQSNADTVFDHSSEIAMGCNIHDWMSGHLLVVDTPYFAKSNGVGVANFSNVKSGKYQIVVWHPQLQEKNNRVVIEKEINNSEVFSIDLTAVLEELPVQENDEDFDFLSDY